MTEKRFGKNVGIVLLAALAALAFITSVEAASSWGTLSLMHDYSEAFGLSKSQQARSYRVTPLEASQPGGIYYDGERPEFDIQIENLSDQPIKQAMKIDIQRYALTSVEGSSFVPRITPLGEATSFDLSVDLPAKGWGNYTIHPPTPVTKGGYALIADMGTLGRHYITSYVRAMKPDMRRVRFPKQALDSAPPPILKRMGVKAIRLGIRYMPSDSRDHESYLAEIDERLTDLHENNVTIAAEFGSGHEGLPLGRGAAHLDSSGLMKGGKEDLVWMPQYDPDFTSYVHKLLLKHGWPKGCITGVMLWNEPWESYSISGWQSDIPRYREIYAAMGEGVELARRDGMQVLIGGCDSTANTVDKLFPDGKDTFMKYFDFCSLHYQGLATPALKKSWLDRPQGRPLIWDTESWVANADDCFSAVVAGLRASGYDRTLGSLSRIAVSTLSHHRTAYDVIRTENGPLKRPRHIETRPLAAVYCATQHFLGEREFKEILFKSGLPWVYVFHGENGNDDDGVVVVVGDIATHFYKAKKGGYPIFTNVRSLAELNSKAKLRNEYLDTEAANHARQKALVDQLNLPDYLKGAEMIVEADEDSYQLYDYYGNLVPTKAKTIDIPLNSRGFMLKPNRDKRGSMARLIKALKNAEIVGLETLDIVAYDMTRTVDNDAELRLRLTSQRNSPIEGSLEVRLGNLNLQYPKELSFAPRERKVVKVRVSGGRPDPANLYALAVGFEVDGANMAAHEELIRCNVISKQSVKVDADLSDWEGALPLPVFSTGGADLSFQEEMYKMGSKATRHEAGAANGYAAYDEDYFYFAAKIKDSSEFVGSIRYAERDDDSFFYPEVSYSQQVIKPKDKKKRGRESVKSVGGKTKHVWPEGVRRYAYRRNIDCPWNNEIDNVLIAFNATEAGEDETLSHFPGTMPGYSSRKTTDHEFAFNHVAPEYGGGSEVWRLLIPGMERIHFFPRQPYDKRGGPVDDAKMAVKYVDGYRLFEGAIPWSEIPAVQALKDAGETVKFAFRINSNQGTTLQTGKGRSACAGFSFGFHPEWRSGFPNNLEFSFEQ